MKTSLRPDARESVRTHRFVLLILLFTCMPIALSHSATALRASAVPYLSPALDASLESCSSQNFPFIFLNVSVKENGTPVTDLTEDNFQCFENGILQTDLFSVTPPEVGGGVRLADIVFLIDASGSMGGEIADVRANVNAFAQALAASDIDFRLGLVRFGNSDSIGPNPFLYNGGNLTDDVGLFQSFIDSLGATGSVQPGFLALRMAVQGFNFRPGAQKVFILISDEDSDDRDKQTTIDLLLANDVTVHTAVDCSFGTSQSDYCDETSVRGVTGGLLFNVIGPYDQIFDTIVARAAATYVLRYRSSNPTFDGTTRNVECIVSNTTTDSVFCSYIPGAAPRIELTPETIALSQTPLIEGSSPTIRALVTDQVEPFVQAVTLFFRRSGTGDAYSSIAMVPIGGDIYEATIPPVSTPGVDYFIRTTDGQVTSSLPSTDPGQFPFQIAVLPNESPEITHTPVTNAPANVDLTIGATATDSTNFLASVELKWRHVGELLYDSIEMVNVGSDQFEATIPGNEVAEDIEYYIRATDDLGVASTVGTPDSPLLVAIGGPTDPPTDLVQLLTDGTKICVGGTVDERTVVFKGMVTDPDGDRVKLQVELRRLDELGGEFDETQGGLKESDLVATGSEATCEAHGLIPSDYHWRARAVDEHGEVSEWVDFGNNLLSEPDITVVSEEDDNPRIVCIEPESGAPGIEAKITGKNFDNILLFQIVYFGWQSAIMPDWSDTEIVFTVPYPPGEERTVDVWAGPFPSSNSVRFTYKEPFIDWITPSSGYGGEEITISGKDFGYNLGPSFYTKFGCSSAYEPSWTDTEIVAEAPSDYGTGEDDREFLKNLIKLVVAGWTIGSDIPDWVGYIDDWIIDKIVDKLLECPLEIPSEGRMRAPVRVYTPVDSSNEATFEYRISTIIEAYLCSPGELRVYDSLGRVTGVVNGEVKEEIPHSLCDGSSVIVVSPHDSYRFEVVGTDQGTYGLGLNSVEEGEATTFVATDIPTSADATHQYIVDWDALSEGKEGVTVRVDSDGDGIFEQDFTADSDLTRDEFLAGDTTPPATVTDLVTANPTTDSITLSWTAPGDDGNSRIVDVHDTRDLASPITERHWDEAVQCRGEPTHQTAGASETFPYKVYCPIMTKNHRPGHDRDLGTASEYDIRYSTSPITNANWDAAARCVGESAPQPPGSRETFTVKGLAPGTTYYFVLKTADEVPNWSGLSNVAPGTTLRPQDTTPPATVTNLRTSNPTVDSMTLNWTAPGDDGNTGTASQYDIRHSTSPITDANWNAADQCGGEPAPQPAGSGETFTAHGLNPNTTYYFALKTADEVPNWSSLSNVASGATQRPSNQLIINCGFETDEGWVFGESPRPAAYTTEDAHWGARSVRLGIKPPTTDAYSWSSVRQRITIPSNAKSATLSFWYKPFTECTCRNNWQQFDWSDFSVDQPGRIPPDRNPRTWASCDWQQALILADDFPNPTILATVMNTNSNSGVWTHQTFDLTPFAGQTVWVYFNVYNDGWGYRRTWMYVDDASVMVYY